ncbi:MAG TPA: GIY-YIG nuclease family protein, partial [Polyangiaceae bacterium]|nr:GIY-YIG nuclease family protein [Polyangiaceae bacterium]
MAELSELPVWLFDCQTTGASPAHGVVLELGWGVACGGRPVLERQASHWVALPVGVRVSRRVRELTGFDEHRAMPALEAEHVWARLRADMAQAARVPAAIHFAKFELAFLRDWAARFEPAAGFPLDAVCLHAIAERLHPDLPRQSLRALAGFLGHGLDLTRRCAAHVEASAFIWHKLVAQLAERGVSTWAELASWLSAPKPRRERRRFPLPSARYRGLPDAPGVYRFCRANGDLLYVGKAASLKKRVSGHHTAGAATTPRALEMLTQVHDVQVTRTATALEAALLENEEIKRHRPLYNLQLTNDGQVWFVSPGFDSAARAPDALHLRGPLPSLSAVRALGAVLALLGGAPSTAALRAAAVEVRERWAPGEAPFDEAFGQLVACHALGSSSEPAQRGLRRVARALLLAARASPRADDEPVAAEDASPEGAWSWDVERVTRHLERAVWHGHQLLARARWLCVLGDSGVVFR